MLFKEEEVAYHLNDCDAKALIAWEGFYDSKAGFDRADACEHLVIIPQGPKDTKDYKVAINFNVLIGGAAPKSGRPAKTSPLDTAIILYKLGTTGKPARVPN